MPPKKIDKAAPIDVDGTALGVGKIGLDDVEVQQEEQKKAARPEYWSDTSDDESYGKVDLTVRQTNKTWQVYGGHESDRFYLPPSGHRASMDEGNHIVPSAFIKFFISALERKNIKTLPQDFRKVLKTLLPERSAELEGDLEQLELQIKESRETRKELTSKVGLPHDRSNDEGQNKALVERAKTRFISADRSDIQRELERISSRFLEIFEEENKCPNSRSGASGNQGEGPCLARLITLQEFLDYNGDIDENFLHENNPQSTSRRAADLRVFTNFTGDYRPDKTPIHVTRLSQKLTSLRNFTDKSQLIPGISRCITQTFDYKRTKNPDVQEGEKVTRIDDEALLYKSLARLIVVTFTSFDGIISKLTPDEKRTLYNTILNDVLTSNEWRVEKKQQNQSGVEEILIDAHQVMDDTKKPIDLDILKRGVEKFAKIDFGNQEDGNPIVVIKMRDPKDPNISERPQAVIYCTDRPVVIATTLSTPNTNSSKKSSNKKMADSDAKATDDNYNNIEALVSSKTTPISRVASLVRTQSPTTKPDGQEKPKEVTKKSVKATLDSHKTFTGKPSSSPSTSDSETETLKQKVNKSKNLGNTISRL